MKNYYAYLKKMLNWKENGIIKFGEWLIKLIG
jgi:hypothetical protein